MRSREEIETALSNVEREVSEFPGMSYEQGVEEALLWILEEIQNDEFEYAKK